MSLTKISQYATYLAGHPDEIANARVRRSWCIRKDGSPLFNVTGYPQYVGPPGAKKSVKIKEPFADIKEADAFAKALEHTLAHARALRKRDKAAIEKEMTNA